MMLMMVELLLVMTSLLSVQTYRTLVRYVQYDPWSSRCIDVQGCLLPNKECLHVNKERSIDCVKYRCHRYEDVYRLSTSIACGVPAGTCVFINPGESKTVDCVEYTCSRYQGVSFLLMNRACRLPGGECLYFGETRNVGCVEYTCQETRDERSFSTNGDCLQSYGTCSPPGMTELCYNHYSLCTWFSKSCRIVETNTTTIRV